MTRREPLRIGQVCDSLKEEFPDLSISKLRFLEEQGLVTPERTPGGYRMYTDENMRELRSILTMQRDEFLPLKVIREELKKRLGSSQARTLQGAKKISLTGAEEMVPFDVVVERLGVQREFVEECRRSGVVVGQKNADGRILFSVREAGIVQASMQMHRLGLGIRHLRQVRSAVSRVAGLVEQYAAARLRMPDEEARKQAVGHVELLASSLVEFIRLSFMEDVVVMSRRTFLQNEKSKVNENLVGVGGSSNERVDCGE